MTDTIENMNNDIDLQLEEMLDELRANTIIREARMAYEVVEYVEAA